MICQQCNSELEPTAKACPQCLTPVSVRGSAPKIPSDGQCSWANSNSSAARCQVKSHDSFLCHWHQMNAVGRFDGIEGPPRSASDRQLFDKWIEKFEDGHAWATVDRAELWEKLQGGE
jgi:hypothetical protein